jgi:Protein of unknown function (DUF3106)
MPTRLAPLALALALALGPGWATASGEWAALTQAQKQALAPLERDWPSIDGPRRAKWLEVAARFPTMAPDERARLQARMAEWTRMTPAERSSARLQFQATRQLPKDERQAQWDAYQALPAEQRQALAQKAKPAPRSGSGNTAAAKTQPDAGKRNLVQTTAAPQPRAVSPTVQRAGPGATTRPMTSKAPLPPSHTQAGLPKIAATPHFVDPATLLPKRGPQGAAARTAASTDPTEQP